MPSNIIKYPWYLSTKFLNSNNSAGDPVVGGNFTTVPANIGGSQGQQDLPGDRIILGAADALALSDNTVGNLYGGIFQYVGTRNNSSSAPTRGHAGFWDLAASSNAQTASLSYQVNSDEPANITTRMFAGVFINSPTKGNFWWLQTAGKVNAQFRTTLTAAGNIGAAAYLSGAANNNNAVDVGSFDVLQASNIGAGPIAAANFVATVEDLIQKYAGVCEVAASNNNISLIDMPFGRQFRW